MKKFNIILNVTTSCNYKCSYCDVIKDKKNISKKNLDNIIFFIEKNKNIINRFKFFGGEPTLSWKNIKYIIDNSNNIILNNYEIVTNATLLTDEIGEYFKKYFKIIFFSIDTENIFDYEKIERFIIKYNLQDKVYFNLIISPNKEKSSLEQFYKLYNMGFKGFNILPVYFTKTWSKNNLSYLSKIMKEILDLSLEDKKLRLSGFQENLGREISLANNTIFIDIDIKIYYSDIVSTFNGKKIKKELYLGNIEGFNLKEHIYNKFNKEKISISKLEEYIYNKIKGQKELHKIMDYFSKYLNSKNAK